SPDRASAVSRACGCSARPRPPSVSTSLVRSGWVTVWATSSPRGGWEGAPSWWRRAAGRRTRRKHAPSASPSWRTSRPPPPRLCAAASARRLRGDMEPWRLVLLLAMCPWALAAQANRTIALGDTVRDSLTRRDALLPAESTYAQQWRLAGRAGQTITIDFASSAFDAYAFLLGPGF